MFDEYSMIMFALYLAFLLVLVGLCGLAIPWRKPDALDDCDEATRKLIDRFEGQ